MKKLAAKIFLVLFVTGLIILGIQSCSDDYGDYGDYGDIYEGVTEQLP